MQSKTSFFNSAIFKKNLSRTWIIGLIWLLLQLYTLPMTYILNMGSNVSARNALTAPYNLILTINDNPITYFAAFFVIAVFVFNFSYLYNKRDSYMMHAFPVSRKALFFTGVATSMLVLLVPVILCGLVTTAVSATTGAGYFAAIWYNALAVMVEIFIESGIALFTMMISGQALTTVIFFFIFNFLYTAIRYVFYFLATYLMYGMENALLGSEKNNIFTPMLYIARHCAVDYSTSYDSKADAITTLSVEYIGAGTLVIYVIAGIVLAAVAYLIYQKKQLETVHDFITVPVMKWIFAIGMSFFVSLYLGVFAVSVVRYSMTVNHLKLFVLATVVTLVAGAIIYFAAQMLIAKNIRIFNKKNFLSCGIYSAAVLVFLLGVNFDIAGVESKVPDASDVVWAGIQGDYTQVYTDEANIKLVIAAHEALIDDKAEIRDMAYSSDTSKYVNIKYKLKSGKFLSRSYQLQNPATASASDLYTETVDTLLTVTNDPDNIKEHIIGKIWNDCQITNMSFSQVSFDENSGYSYMDESLSSLDADKRQEAYQAVYEALLKDIDAGVILTEKFDYNYDDNYYNDFSLVIRNDKINYISDSSLYDDYESDDIHETNIYISLNPDCTNTLAALKEYGFYTSDDQLVLYKTVNDWNDSNY